MYGHNGKFNGTQFVEGQQLYWPGTEAGYPVKAATPVSLRDSEFEGISEEYQFRSRIFRLPADENDYIDVNDKIINGLFVRLHQDRHYDPVDSSYVVHLEWAEIYGRSPDARSGPPR